MPLIEGTRPELLKLLTQWLEDFHNVAKCDTLHAQIVKELELIPEHELTSNRLLFKIKKNSDSLTVRSFWFLGGDGWAYDIGYGGIDHVLSRDANVNILVVDTEMYSNTGGQVSKSTQIGASVKYSQSGKTSLKKDLGMKAMTYEHVYVASIALGANHAQAVQAMVEAESYPGPSLILAFSPCIDWGLKDMSEQLEIQKLAVDSGYWPLYRYDPRKKTNKFQLDSKRLKMDVSHFLKKQARFEKLKMEHPDIAENLHKQLQDSLRHKNELMRKMAMDDFEHLDYLKKKLGEKIGGEKSLILYGSQTGNSQYLAESLHSEFKMRGARSTCMSMDDYDIDDLPNESHVYCVISTQGQGDFPSNSKSFIQQLYKPGLPKDHLKSVKFAVFGLGDSSYVFFNKASESLDQRLEELGAVRLLELGKGDDKDPDRFETKWDIWSPTLIAEAKLPKAPDVPPVPSYSMLLMHEGECEQEVQEYMPKDSQMLTLMKNERLTPEDHDRNIRHFEFNLKDTDWSYSSGDVLAIYPHNNQDEISNFLDSMEIKPTDILQLDKLASDAKSELISPLTTETLFKEILDIFGKPNIRFYDFLYKLAKDKREKKHLKHLTEKEGKTDREVLLKESFTYADLLHMFPSTKASIPQLIDAVPKLRPRLYSIASSNEMHSDKIELCVIINDWTTPQGKERKGTTTGYLEPLTPGAKVAAKLQEGGCSHPKSHDVPLVMVGLGTGVAPLRAFIQERVMRSRAGEQCGDLSLYFGMRNKASEYLYGEEFEKYHEEGVLTNLRPAFSRDQEQKVYCQHKMMEDSEKIYQDLVKDNGYFYLCGSSNPDVENAVLQSFMKHGQMTEKQAKDYVTKMRLAGRYNLDTW